MTSLADRTIASMRTVHDGLVALVGGLNDDQLAAPSGSAEWDVAQVLSHLGSGGEITLAGLSAVVAGEPSPDQDFNQGVWDRWNAKSNREKADGYVQHGEAVVAAFEGLTADQRANLEVQLGFLPFPLPIAAVAGMRFNELALHAWDAAVAFDPAATVDSTAADLLIEQFVRHLGFMLGFTAKADQLAAPATVAIPGGALVIADAVSLVASAPETTAAFNGPAEAFVRLLSGRLTPERTPDSVAVSGTVSLDDLRRVFAGY